ncbi:MAG: hypothetical protein ACOY9Y_11465 [Bacillota bacterium]
MTFKGCNFQLWSKPNVIIIKLILMLSIVLVNQGCAGQAKKEPAKTVTVPEPIPVVTTISKEVFRIDDRVIEVPIQWSKDSRDLYYVTYQSDKSVPLEIWKFDGQKKVKVAQLDYREEYNNYHLGATIKRSSWSPSNDMLGFILEIGWGNLYQLVILNVKTGKIEFIDNIYDFDWHPTEDKLVLVKLFDKLAEPPYLKTIAMAYDLAEDQLTELPGLPKDILAVAFDNSGSLYVAEMESQYVFQVFRIDSEGNKQYLWSIRGRYVELGKHLLPSLDRSRIALIYSHEKGRIVMLHDVTRQETKEVFRGDVKEFSWSDVKEVSWGEGNTLQLVISERENWTTKILLFAGEDSITVEALFPLVPPADDKKRHVFPSTLAPDNRKFLVEDFESYGIDIVELN